VLDGARFLKSPEIHVLIFQALKSPELGLGCRKSREIFECGVTGRFKI